MGLGPAVRVLGRVARRMASWGGWARRGVRSGPRAVYDRRMAVESPEDALRRAIAAHAAIATGARDAAAAVAEERAAEEARLVAEEQTRPAPER